MNNAEIKTKLIASGLCLRGIGEDRIDYHNRIDKIIKLHMQFFYDEARKALKEMSETEIERWKVLADVEEYQEVRTHAYAMAGKALRERFCG